MKRQWIFIILWIAIYIAVRSIFFVEGLNFSQDQAADSLRGLTLMREGIITLIGTHTGYTYQGRLLFQGPLFIYTYLLFNLLGGFDPVQSTYIFVLVGSLSVVPLYFGLKKLSNEAGAQIGVICYALLPYFVDYTRFLWNPNFQFISTPYLIYAFAQYHTSRSLRWLGVTTILIGVLLQHHYQYLLLIGGLGLYLLFQRKPLLPLAYLIGGLVIGFLPVLIFELRHDFYNLRTALLFLQHYREVFFIGTQASVSPHFFLSPTLALITLVLMKARRHLSSRSVVIVLIVLSLLTVQRLHRPDRMFNAKIPWTYADELRVYKIIKAHDLTQANIAILPYDNEAVVQKFFLARDSIRFAGDYYTNRYLFAVSKTNRLDSYTAYEVQTFAPRIIVDSWPITNQYTLYLLKRVEK